MNKLKLARLISGKTQKQLAKEIGLTQPLISMFETDKVIPGESLMKTIAMALSKSEDELF